MDPLTDAQGNINIVDGPTQVNLLKCMFYKGFYDATGGKKIKELAAIGSINSVKSRTIGELVGAMSIPTPVPDDPNLQLLYLWFSVLKNGL